MGTSFFVFLHFKYYYTPRWLYPNIDLFRNDLGIQKKCLFLIKVYISAAFSLVLSTYYKFSDARNHVVFQRETNLTSLGWLIRRCIWWKENGHRFHLGFVSTATDPLQYTLKSAKKGATLIASFCIPFFMRQKTTLFDFLLT